MATYLIVEDGPHKGLLLRLEGGDEWMVGKDPILSDFFLDEETVSRKHARISKTDRGIVVKNFSRIHPTLLNGEPLLEPTVMQLDDHLLLGPFLFTLKEGTIPSFAYPPPSPQSKTQQSYNDIFQDTPEESPLSEEEDSLEDLPTKKQLETLSEDLNHERERTAYDTIFDEEELQEELPFPLLPDTPLLLKVISGPNAGAEIGIEKGKEYTIGKDVHQCDILFQDLSVSRSHARLSIDEEAQAFLEDLGSKNGTIVNGHPLKEKTRIYSHDVIAVGTTVFLVLDREAPQETIYAAIPPLAQEPEEPSSLEDEKEAKEPLVEQDPLAWKKEPLPKKHLITGGISLVAFLVLFLTFFSLFTSRSLEPPHKEPLAKIEEALAPFPAVTFSFNPGSNQLFLVGHVLTSTQYQEMLYRLNQLEFLPPPEDMVVIDEKVAKTMNDILQPRAAWKGVTIRPIAPGKFNAVGFVATSEQMGLLSEFLTANFPYLDRLEIRVAIADQLETQLQTLLIGKGFGAISVSFNQGNVVLSGMYSESKEKDFHHLLQEIHKIHGVLNVQNLAQGVSKDMSAIDLSEKYQVTGSSLLDGKGYSVIINGKIYTLGDRLDGMQISQIATSTISLEKDGIKYKIEYTAK